MHLKMPSIEIDGMRMSGWHTRTKAGECKVKSNVACYRKSIKIKIGKRPNQSLSLIRGVPVSSE